MFLCWKSYRKIFKTQRFYNTVAASGTVNALKNIIINSEKNIKNLAYLCGDVVSYELDNELTQEGFKVSKIINYTSTKITDLNKKYELNQKISSKYCAYLL